VTSERD